MTEADLVGLRMAEKEDLVFKLNCVEHGKDMDDVPSLCAKAAERIEWLESALREIEYSEDVNAAGHVMASIALSGPQTSSA